MKPSKVLLFDALINFILGILLLLLIPFPNQLPELLGVPKVQEVFYPTIMGAVFIGIAVALVVEAYRSVPHGFVGLGLGGAIAINLSGGAALVGWLVFGKLEIALHGKFFLWGIAIILMLISVIELTVHNRRK
ncbi:MAG: hypothetical protein HN855_15030 [Anaerolineae bacterium]|jgi:hypothetical protein|nr:hypothetical protein [Anaerolineae bacterium]MBT7071894.1 hypothetical protein [Anaerolineae bacterium]MBT7326468.1 hypothetical protein [Anaerolineae bacterium]